MAFSVGKPNHIISYGTLDDVERPLRTLLPYRPTCVYRATQI